MLAGDLDECREVRGVQVGVGEQPGAREDLRGPAEGFDQHRSRAQVTCSGHVLRSRARLLDIGLVGKVAGGLLEDDVVEREGVAERIHHFELVEQPVGVLKVLVLLDAEALARDVG